MALLNRMLIIVAHAHQAQYTYLKHAFEKEAMDVIFDRRAGERRQLVAMDRARSERRGRDRRQRDITKRSEEHTSELQSLAYLVCRLLLEKKKKNSHANATESAIEPRELRSIH